MVLHETLGVRSDARARCMGTSLTGGSLQALHRNPTATQLSRPARVGVGTDRCVRADRYPEKGMWAGRRGITADCSGLPLASEGGRYREFRQPPRTSPLALNDHVVRWYQA